MDVKVTKKCRSFNHKSIIHGPCSGRERTHMVEEYIFRNKNAAWGLCTALWQLKCNSPSKDPVFHSRTKHIQMSYHFIRKLINEGTLNLKKIHGTKNSTYMFTKVFTTKNLKLCMNSTALLDVWRKGFSSRDREGVL